MEQDIVSNLYKVVRVEKDGFYSVNVNYPSLRTKYNYRNFTIAPVGGFLVFDNLEKAIRFAQLETNVNNTHFAIFRCDGVGEIKKGSFCDYVFDFVESEAVNEAIQLCWGLNQDPEKMDTLEKGGFPPGTRAFEKIYLGSYVCSISEAVKKRL